MGLIVPDILSLPQHLETLEQQPVRYRPVACPHCGLAKPWGHGCYQRKADRRPGPDGALNPIPDPTLPLLRLSPDLFPAAGVCGAPALVCLGHSTTGVAVVAGWRVIASGGRPSGCRSPHGPALVGLAADADHRLRLLAAGAGSGRGAGQRR